MILNLPFIHKRAKTKCLQCSFILNLSIIANIFLEQDLDHVGVGNVIVDVIKEELRSGPLKQMNQEFNILNFRQAMLAKENSRELHRLHDVV